MVCGVTGGNYVENEKNFTAAHVATKIFLKTRVESIMIESAIFRIFTVENLTTSCSYVIVYITGYANNDV